MTTGALACPFLEKMKKGFFITFSILLFLFLVYRFFFVGLMYDAYENNNAEYEDSNTLIESSFFPCYDYEGYNILYVHYRRRYDFQIRIKSKSGQIVKAEIINNELIKNGQSTSFMDSNSWTRNGRDMVFMDITEIYPSSITSKYDRKDEYLEYFKKYKTVNFKHEDYTETENYCIYFEIPITYKKDNTVEINLDINLVFEDGHEEIVNQHFGGKKNRYINFL